MRLDMAILFVMFVLPVMLFQLVGSDGALAQSTYAVSARVPATCPKGYSPNLDTGLCPVTCPSNTAPNTKGECVPLPVVIEEQPSVLVTPKVLDTLTPVDPANSMTCLSPRTWDPVLLRCE
mgnify:CR=1 FL=1